MTGVIVQSNLASQHFWTKEHHLFAMTNFPNKWRTHMTFIAYRLIINEKKAFISNLLIIRIIQKYYLSLYYPLDLLPVQIIQRPLLFADFHGQGSPPGEKLTISQIHFCNDFFISFTCYWSLESITTLSLS